jgi:dTMP kinase
MYYVFIQNSLSSYGGERYEKRDLQLRVRKRFDELREADEGSNIHWHMIDAAQSMDDVQRDINVAVMKTLDQVKAGKPLGKLWMEGEYDLKQKAALLEDKEN